MTIYICITCGSFPFLDPRFAPDQLTVADVEGRINNFIDVTHFKPFNEDSSTLDIARKEDEVREWGGGMYMCVCALWYNVVGPPPWRHPSVRRVSHRIWYGCRCTGRRTRTWRSTRSRSPRPCPRTSATSSSTRCGRCLRRVYATTITRKSTHLTASRACPPNAT